MYVGASLPRSLSQIVVLGRGGGARVLILEPLSGAKGFKSAFYLFNSRRLRASDPKLNTYLTSLLVVVQLKLIQLAVCTEMNGAY